MIVATNVEREDPRRGVGQIGFQSWPLRIVCNVEKNFEIC